MEGFRETLIDGLRTLGIPPLEETVSRLTAHLEELRKWNRAYNLTALKDERDFVTGHVLDSLLYLPMIPERPLDICDIGSGAGFPGIPLAVVRPGARVILVEPSRKKSSFLKHVVRRLSLGNVQVITRRIEEMPGEYDIAVTRALFSIADLLKRARHILKPGGFFILSKGPKVYDELKTVDDRVSAEVREVLIPGTSVKRFLVVLVPGHRNSSS